MEEKHKPEDYRTEAEKQNALILQIDRWIDAMEKLRLEEYLRYANDRRRLFRVSFLTGIARGFGMAIGFTILGAVIVLLLQDLAKRNLPLIGDVLAQIMNVVQRRLE